MERFELKYLASASLPRRAFAGVVGSGDMEALYEPGSTELLVIINTSVEGSQSLWRHLFDHIQATAKLPAGRLEINDFGATPGVARLRIEQVFEEACHAQ